MDKLRTALFLASLPAIEAEQQEQSSYVPSLRVRATQAVMNVLGVITVAHYRVRHTGTESGASWYANQDTNATVAIAADTLIKLRLSLKATTLAISENYELQVSHNGGAAATVTSSSTYVQGGVDSNVTDGGNTTNQLTADTTYETHAGIANNVNAESAAIQLSTNHSTEVEWTLKLIFSALSNNDTLDFTLTEANTSGITTTQFSGTIRVTVTKTVTDTKTITGKARVQKTLSATVSGKGRMEIALTATLSGEARVQKTLSATLGGVARIAGHASEHAFTLRPLSIGLDQSPVSTFGL